MTDLSVRPSAVPVTIEGRDPDPSASAVERFERWWESWDGAADGADGRAATYRALLPAEAPGAGRQYRFEVDLDRCTGCKACVTACHSLNGLDDGETWRSVGVLAGGSTLGTWIGRVGAAAAPAAPAAAPVWSQHVTTACHHCVEPACLAGCPVDAYEKDPVTGIVAHLDDQCIGCRYCMLTCPYEVPSFNARLGVVRKCDMCTHRLADGEPPACVQGCPTEAISIGLTDPATDVDARADRTVRLVPTAPRSHLTRPTTVYRTARRVPDDAVAGDDHRLSPAHNHPPLVAMLVLTQLSVGAVTTTELGSRFGGWLGGTDALSTQAAIVAFLTAMVAMAAAVLHLGRPLVAWRAVLGIGHSWLSREIVAFGAYAGIAAATAASAVGLLPRSWEDLLGGVTVASGLFGLWCSARLYAVTGHPLWRIDRVVLRFGATALSAGAATVALVACAAAALADPSTSGTTGTASDIDVRAIGSAAAVSVAVGVAAVLLATVVFVVRHRGRRDALGRSAHLLSHQLRRQVELAVGLGVAGVALALTGALVAPSDPAVGAAVWAACVVAVGTAAWIERELFFTADAPDRMPGGSR
ncbi:MAG: dimethyl sulfoxide reductase anchor subunit [Actinobacteria bacterium]|nr:dimethyl sulfoxide reductase anchor subunit [Actinomycetota bacterium]